MPMGDSGKTGGASALVGSVKADTTRKARNIANMASPLVEIGLMFYPKAYAYA